MKLIFAVLDVSLTMGLTRCYKTEGFYIYITCITARATQQPDGFNISYCSESRKYIKYPNQLRQEYHNFQFRPRLPSLI